MAPETMKYESNSHRSKETQKKALAEKKPVTKVVKSPVKTKKKNEIRKFADVFIAEDAHTVKSYILADVLVPAIKKLVSDIVRDGIDIILYGGTGRKDRNSISSKISYRDYFDRKDNRPVASSRIKTGYDYDELIFDNRGEAEEVLSRMDELIDQYNCASIEDLYDLAGVTSHNYMHNKYGWTNLSSAEAVRAMGGGYKLKMPPAKPI